MRFSQFRSVALWGIIPMGLCFVTETRLSAQEKTAPGIAIQDSASSSEKSVKPGVNRDFLDPNLSVEDYLSKFEVESREVYSHREKLADQLGLRPGMAIADIGSGTGAYLKTFANRVGKQGRVYAVDISPRFVEYLRARTKREELAQVEVILCDDRQTGLAPESVDAVYICDTYHHFEYPMSTLKSIQRALKNDGMLVVVDFDRVPGKSRDFVLSHVRAGKKEFQQEIEAAGFRLIDEPKIEGLQENFVMRFRK